MLQQNPDIILRTSHAMSEEVMKNFETEFAQNDIWSKFSAVQNGKVYNLDNNYFGMSANFNYQKGLENLEGILLKQLEIKVQIMLMHHLLTWR